MPKRFPGNVISSSEVIPTSSAASGVWSVEEAMDYTDRGIWPAFVEPGQQQYTSAGTYSWTAPAGVTSVCVVCVGAGVSSTYGGGGGGALAYKNNISVTPGSSYTVVVPAKNSTTRASFNGDSTVSAGEYQNRTGDGGGDGGRDGYSSAGAGGYSGNGGENTTGLNGGSGSGGGGGAGGFAYNHPPEQYGYAGGGGTGLQGQGSNGSGGTGGRGANASYSGGGGGSGGGSGGSGSMSGYLTILPAGSPGGCGYNSTNCTPGAVRIIWGSGRSFPSTNTADV